MPCELTWVAHGLIEKYFGAFNVDQMNAINEIVASDERFDSLRWVIADFTEAEVGPVAESQLSEAAAMAYAASLTNARFIIANVNPSPVAYENAKRFESFDQPYPYHVCRTMDEALEWVELMLQNRSLGS